MDWITLIITHLIAYLLGSLVMIKPAVDAYERANLHNKESLRRMGDLNEILRKLKEARNEHR